MKYRLRHLNMDKAINHFLENVEELSRLPLVTDNDMLQLWGEEVADSVAELARYSLLEKVCPRCVTRCCPLVHCELYFPGFPQCPIFPYRPAICRMHFCEQFFVNDISFVRELADIYLNSLLEAKLQGSTKVDLFDSPPLGRYAPELLAAVAPSLRAYKEGSLDEDSALKLIQTEAEKFRTSPVALKGNPETDKTLEALLEEARRALYHA